MNADTLAQVKTLQRSLAAKGRVKTKAAFNQYSVAHDQGYAQACREAAERLKVIIDAWEKSA